MNNGAVNFAEAGRRGEAAEMAECFAMSTELQLLYQCLVLSIASEGVFPRNGSDRAMMSSRGGGKKRTQGAPLARRRSAVRPGECRE